MDDTHLYQKIAATIRQDILNRRYKPGERLPSVRRLCAEWNCTPGTIQRAYNELAREGLLVSRVGRGTRVASELPAGKNQSQQALRRASLVHRSETFLLEAVTAGYSLNEVQEAIDLAMDRWRAIRAAPHSPPAGVIRFAGSHDPLLNELVRSVFSGFAPQAALELTYCGSLGGLIALVEGKAEFAGCHLWDAESDAYNLPFVRRLLPGKAVTLITLAHRRQGLIVAPGNPLNIHRLEDLAREDIRFANRQSGSGTRVWLDAMLARAGIAPARIAGYADERLTHSEVARAVAEGAADVGLGLEAAGQAFGLDFIFLNRERYDLILSSETARQAPFRQWIDWLASPDGRQFVAQRRGYENQETGTVSNLPADKPTVRPLAG
ncbi:MAG: substrate-binding domain-containing protein [Bellilinea sp.]